MVRGIKNFGLKLFTTDLLGALFSRAVRRRRRQKFGIFCAATAKKFHWLSRLPISSILNVMAAQFLVYFEFIFWLTILDRELLFSP